MSLFCLHEPLYARDDIRERTDADSGPPNLDEAVAKASPGSNSADPSDPARDYRSHLRTEQLTSILSIVLEVLVNRIAPMAHGRWRGTAYAVPRLGHNVRATPALSFNVRRARGLAHPAISMG